MFYGLNSFIKRILPKKLFYRSLIIVATPIILLQIIITVVFFDSLWIKANKGMTRSLVGEVKTLFDVYKNDHSSKKMILVLYNENFDFVVRLNENNTIKINPQEKKVLEKMLGSPGTVFSREEIGKIINIKKERTIDVMITRLRQKIEVNPKNPKYLQTIRGSGYVLWIE